MVITKDELKLSKLKAINNPSLNVLRQIEHLEQVVSKKIFIIDVDADSTKEAARIIRSNAAIFVEVFGHDVNHTRREYFLNALSEEFDAGGLLIMRSSGGYSKVELSGLHPSIISPPSSSW